MTMFNTFSKRSTESPMDWEWQTQGPTDPKSPFPQFKPQPGQKRGFESTQPNSSFGASSTPAAPFRNPSFTTPRKPFDQDLFSEASGVESSPGDNADAEDTPETKTNTVMTAFANTNLERQPLFGRYGAGFQGHSAGRAERRGKYGNAMVNKIRKRKRIDRDHALILGGRRGSSSDSEDDASRPRSQHLHTETKQGWFSSMLNGIESRPNLPNILSYYAQLGVNFFIAGLTVYGVWTFWITIRSDVDKASDEAAAAVLADMAVCARQFTDNGCHNKNTLPPALVTVCDNWHNCMTQDPASVGRARISAHTFAQIFNSFIEPISYKAMIFIVLVITICVLVNNLAFGMLRSKSPHHTPFFPAHPSTNPAYQWGPTVPPQTPQHQHGFDIYSTPFPQIMPSQGVGNRSPSKGNRSPSKGDRSPGKRDRSPSKEGYLL